ncbi:hypothetical protein BFP72_10645 [Reichenbachiella sp. 5M10]|nr:hypothetical protein BFP72_10645 [Reichenbachiella sp. 5M10]
MFTSAMRSRAFIPFLVLGLLASVSTSVMAQTPSIAVDNSDLDYIENDLATPIDASATVSDPEGDWDGGTMTIQITSNNEAEDEISIPDNVVGTINTNATNLLDDATVIGTLSASEGTVTDGTILTITFNASATDALVQQTLQAVHYRNTSENPGTGDRTVTVEVTDAAANTASDTRTVTVTAENDPPVFTLGGNLTIVVNAGAQTVAGFATSIGDGDGTSQGLTFNVSGFDGTLFATDPSIDEASGELTFTPETDKWGKTTVSVTLEDDGGGATDTSAPQSFDIFITPSGLTINEVDANATDEFVELYDVSASMDLTGTVLVVYNGDGESVAHSVDLSSLIFGADGLLVVGDAAATNSDLDWGSFDIEDGPEAVALFVGSVGDFNVSDPITTDGLIDVLVYGTGGSTELTALETAFGVSSYDEDANGNAGSESLARSTDGVGVFVAQASSPGLTNDVSGPVFVSAETLSSTVIQLTFDESIDEISGTVASFTLDGGVTVTGLAIDGTDDKKLNLTVTGMTTSYTSNDLDITAGAVEDALDNANVETLDQTVADGAAPVVLSAQYLDTDDDALIDRIDVTFSEDISSSTYDAGDWSLPTNNSSLTIASGAVSGSVVQLTVSGAPVDATVIDATTVLYSDLGTTGSVVDGNSNASETGSATAVADGAAPKIVNATMEIDNGYVDVFFSEGVYASPGGGALASTIDTEFNSAFTKTGSGVATDAVVTSITKTDDTGLMGGETVLRFHLSVTGTANGDEYITINSDGSTLIEDASDNNMSASESTGNIYLLSASGYITKSATHTSISSIAEASPGVVVFTFDIQNPYTGGGDDLSFDAVTFVPGVANTSNWSEIFAGAKLEADDDAGDNRETTAITAGGIAFTGINGSPNELGRVNNASTRTFKLSLWLKSSVTDPSTLDGLVTQISLSADDINFTSSSTLSTASSAVSDQIDVDVIATKLILDATDDPTDGTFDRGGVITATVHAVDKNNNYDLGESSTVEVSLSAGSGALSGDLSEDLISGSITFSDLSIDEAGSGKELTFEDAASTLSAVVADNIEIEDTTPPSIAGLNPANGASLVSLNANLVATFDEDMAKGSGSIYIIEEVVPPITHAVIDVNDVTIVDDEVTITPPLGLEPQTNYHVLIQSGALTDASGVAFSGISNASVWAFSTAEELVMLSVETSVSDLTLVFNKDIDLNSSVLTDFVIQDAVGTSMNPTAVAVDGTEDNKLVLSIDLSGAKGDLTMSFTATTTVVTDATSTLIWADIAGYAIDFDQTVPSLQSATKDSDTQITLTYDDIMQVSGANPGDFTIVDGAGTGYTVTATNTTGTNEEVILTTASGLNAAVGDLTVSYDDSNQEVSDLGGNFAASEVIVIDTDNDFPEALVSFNSPAVALTNSSTVVFDVEFDEAIDGANFTLEDIVVDLAGATVNGIATDELLANNSAFGNQIVLAEITPDTDYTVTISSIAGNGDLGITLLGSGIQDYGGNLLGGSTGVNKVSSTYDIDNVKPTVVFSTVTNPTNSSSFVVNAAFSEAVSTVENSDFALSDGSLVVGTASGNTYPLTITPTADQTADITISLIDDKVLDNAGNDNDVSESFTVGFDDVSPTITSSFAAEGRELSLVTQLNEVGKVYWAVYPDGTAPTPTVGEIQAGTGASSFGSLDHNVGATDRVTSIALGADNTNYDVYLVAEDNLGNVSTTADKLDVSSGGVLITAPTLTDLCLNGEYQLLGDIVLTESIPSDFRSSATARTLKLELPTGFEFDNSAGSVNHTTGGDISASSILSHTSSVLQVSYTVTSQSSSTLDVLTISGLKVRAVGSSAYTSEAVLRTGGSGTIHLADESDGRVFATLTSVAPFDTPVVSGTNPGTGSPYLTENAANTAAGDVAQDGKAMYLVSSYVGTTTPFTVNLLSATNTVTVYTSEDLSSSLTPFTGATTYSPSLADLGITSSTKGMTHFWITTTDGNSCESEALRYTVVLLEDTNSAGVTTFTEDNTSGTNITFSLPDGYTATFIGAGLTNISYDDSDNNLGEATFIPSAAGANGGIPHEVYYQITETSTGVSASYILEFVVNPTARVFDVTPVSFCYDEGVQDFSVGTSGDVELLIPTVSGSDFYDVKVYEYKDGVRQGVDVSSTTQGAGVLLSKPVIPPLGATSTSGWSFRPSQTDPDDGDTLIFALELRTSLGVVSEYATQAVVIYAVPEIVLDNDADADVFDAYYCADDDAFDINVTITSDLGVSERVTTTGYTLYYDQDGDGDYTNQAAYIYDFTSGGGDFKSAFDPKDPNGDGNLTDDESGDYLLEYSTPAIGPAGCSNTSTVEFTVFPVPNSPLLSNDFTNVGGLTGGEYILEYTEGNNVVPDLIATGTGSGQFDWYRDIALTSSIELNSATLQGSGTGGLIINTNGAQNQRVFLTETTNIVTGSPSFEGCVSEPRVIDLSIYDTPDEPVVDYSMGYYSSSEETYIFEYCVPTAASVASVPNITLIDNFDTVEGDETYVTVYDKDQNPLMDGKVTSLDLSAITGLVDDEGNPWTATGGQSLTFYLTQTDHDNDFPGGTSLGIYGGARSEYQKVIVNVNVTPDAPDESDFTGETAEYFICSGETLPNIVLSNETTPRFTWYPEDSSNPGNPDTTTPMVVGSFNDRFATMSELVGFSNVNNATDNSAIVYHYYVQQSVDYNDFTSFEGCQSAFTEITITVYPESPTPQFNIAGTPTQLEINVCEGELGNVSFGMTSSFPATFYWYPSTDGVTLSSTTPRATSTEGLAVSGFDLAISTATQTTNGGVLYFLISQVNNNGVDFVGCETALSDMAVLKINIKDIPSAPTEDNNVEDFYYCEGESISSITVEGETAATFNWYTDSDGDGVGDVFLGTYTTITSAQLGVDNNVVGDYVFYVSQNQTNGVTGLGIDGLTSYQGCEGEQHEITVHVRSIPTVPTLNFTSQLVCDNDVSTVLPEFQVLNPAVGGLFNWVQEDVSSANDVVDGADVYHETRSLNKVWTPSFTDMRVANNGTDQNHYLVSQVTDYNISGSSFEGCESPVASFEVTIHDVPTSPTISGNDGNNAFVYCADDTMTNLIVANTTDYNSTATYNWYSNSGLTLGINTSESSDGTQIAPDDHPSFPTINTTTHETTDVLLSYYVTVTEDGCSSNEFAANSTTVTLDINPLPTLSIDVPSLETGSQSVAGAYCVSTDEVELVGYLGAVQATSGVYTLSTGNSAITNNGDGTADFDPSTAHFFVDDNGVTGVESGGNATSHTVTFTYTDATTGCANSATEVLTVNPLAGLSLTSNETGFNSSTTFAICESHDDFILEATTLTGSDDVKYYVNNTSLSLLSGSNSKATFEPSYWANDVVGQEIESLSPTGISADYTVRLEYDDVNGCSNSVTKVIQLYDQPEVTFDWNGGCTSRDLVFEATPTDDTNYLDSQLSYQWAWKNEDGAAVPLYPGEVNTGKVVSKKLELGANDVEEAFSAELVGTYTISGSTSSETSCSSILENNVTIQEFSVLISPTVAFVWDTVVVNQPTSFFINELILESTKIDSIGLNPGDGSDTIWYDVPQPHEIYFDASQWIGANDDFERMIHEYTMPGKYDATVTMVTDNNCRTNLTRSVNILPLIEVTTDNPYFQSFEAASFDPDVDGWYAETLKDNAITDTTSSAEGRMRMSSWVWHTTSIDDIVGVDTEKPTASGVAQWATLLNEDGNNVRYNGSEDSWLYSPAFDLSGMSKPMLSFTLIYEFEDSKDGVVFQYSTDYGQKWQVLGSNDGGVSGIKSGIEWYNWDNVGADPGQQQEAKNENTTISAGWAGASKQTTWVSARHSLDVITEGLDHVQFRFALASTEETSSAKPFGFAFDDFMIQERTKNVLIEQFYSVSDDEGADAVNAATISLDNQIDDLLLATGLTNDQLSIAYHVDFQTSVKDPFHALNVADPTARRSWYNIDHVTSLLNGDEGSNASGTSGSNLTWTENDLVLSSLEDPGFLIDVIPSTDVSNSTISGQVTFTVNTPLGFEATDELIAYVAIIEQQVETEVGGMSTHKNVLRKLLPSETGQYIKLKSDVGLGELLPIGSTTDADGDPTTLDIRWDISNINDDAQLAAVVFIQNRKTKEIYQSKMVTASDASSIVGNKTTVVDNILGVEGDLVSSVDFKLFPNPSDQEVTVQFNASLNESVDWVIYDQTGRAFDRGRLDHAMEGFKLSTSQLPTGVYFVSIQGDQHKFEFKKLMIHH